MNAKLITPILALCSLPLSAKVYTVQSLLGDMVVNINVDKSITWDITKGKTLVLKPSVISLQTDRQTFGVNPKVRKVPFIIIRTMIMVAISNCFFPATDMMWNSGFI